MLLLQPVELGGPARACHPGGSLTYRVAAAIDFGTHGSGFAWAVRGTEETEQAPDTIDYFDQWDDATLTYPKNLTTLLIDEHGTPVSWGYTARKQFTGENGTRLEKSFKMWLSSDTAQQRSSGGDLVGKRKDALPLITSYLRFLRKTALTRIEAGSFAEHEVRWCLTVPALWNQAERRLMRQAAEDAGFPAGPDQLLLVTEPEAAAIYCATDPRAGLGGTGTRPTLVVDCGGGTVDIASYRHRRDGTLEELRRPAGGKMGSNYINERFKSEVLRPRLGQKAYEALEARPDLLMGLMDKFEQGKTSFHADTEDDVRVEIPRAAERLIEPLGGMERLRTSQNGHDDDIRVEAPVMRTLFDGSVGPLVQLVQTQVKDLFTVEEVRQEGLRLILVGGFAQSRYVSARLTEELGRTHGSSVRIVSPPHPARAVLGGAVHYASRPQVMHARRAVLSYGIEVSERPEYRWRMAKPQYTKQRKKIKPVKGEDGERYLHGMLLLFVRAGDSVETGTTVQNPLLPLTSTQAELSIPLYSSPDPDARTIHDADARVIGEITVNIAESIGKPPEERAVEVVFRFGGTEIEVFAKNPRTGERARTHVQFSGTSD